MSTYKRRYMSGFYSRFCQGKGLHIGYGEEAIKPGVDYIKSTEKDVTKIPSEDGAYNFVYATVLQETTDPVTVCQEWWRLIAPGGFLILVAQDEDLYEQRRWPSAFNTRHQCTLTISKDKSWSPVSHNITDIIYRLPNHHTISLALCDEHLDYTKLGKGIDQCAAGAETFIEAVIFKAPM